MSMITLTPEQLRLVEQAGRQPVRVEDPKNHRTYLLVEETPSTTEPGSLAVIPEEIRRSQDAFFRDLPDLLEDESLRGLWVAYHGDERIGIASSMKTLIQECNRRGLRDDQYDAFMIEPHSREIEEVDFPSSWLT